MITFSFGPLPAPLDAASWDDTTDGGRVDTTDETTDGTAFDETTDRGRTLPAGAALRPLPATSLQAGTS